MSNKYNKEFIKNIQADLAQKQIEREEYNLDLEKRTKKAEEDFRYKQVKRFDYRAKSLAKSLKVEIFFGIIFLTFAYKIFSYIINNETQMRINNRDVSKGNDTKYIPYDDYDIRAKNKHNLEINRNRKRRLINKELEGNEDV